MNEGSNGGDGVNLCSTLIPLFMKSRFGLFVFMVLLFTSCDLLEGVGDVDLNAEIPTATFTVNAASPGNIVQVVTVELEQDAEIKKYISAIKDVQIEGIDYEISDVAVGTLTDVKLEDFSLRANGLDLIPKSSVNVFNARGTLALNTGNLVSVASKLLKDKFTDVDVTASLNKAPVNFKLKLYFKVKVKANALK